LSGGLAALSVEAASVAAQDENVYRRAGCRMERDGTAAAQDLVKRMRSTDEDG
jgi:hypothetical protein